MTQMEMELMRALVAVQAALWKVVDGEHGAKDMLLVMVANVVSLTDKLMERGK